MAQKISQMTSAGTLVGTEQLEVSQLSTTVTITAATLSALNSDNSYNDSGSGFVTAGFAVGDTVKVTGFGSSVNNIFSGTVTALTPAKMTIGGTDGDVIIDGAAGSSVTITKWNSRRTPLPLVDNDATLAADSATNPPSQAAMRGYITNTLNARKFKGEPVRAKTTTALAANTYANGTAGVGATLTGNANGALAAQDGVTLIATDSLLVANEAAGANSGIYTVTQVGSAGTPYILTRRNDADVAAELPNATVYVSEGTAAADQQWTCTTNAPITVGTTALVFAQTGTGSLYTADETSLHLASTVFSIKSNGVLPGPLNDAAQVTLASAATVNIGAAGSASINISGTTTITAFDSIASGSLRRLLFAGALTLTYNATSLILPTSASIVTVAGDVAVFESLGGGNWRCIAYQRRDGTALAGAAGGGTKTYGVFTPMTSQPPASNYATLDTRNSIAVLDFDDTTSESAVWTGVMPEAASLGSGLIVKLHWMATTATANGVTWAASFERMNTDEDSDSFDTATNGSSTTSGTSGILTVTSITCTTIDSIAAGDAYRIKIARLPSDGSDTMSGDAELVAVEVRSAA